MTLASAAKAGCFCGTYGAAEAAPFQNKVVVGLLSGG